MFLFFLLVMSLGYGLVTYRADVCGPPRKQENKKDWMLDIYQMTNPTPDIHVETN